MVRIKQHANDRSLNDVSRFLADIDRFFNVDHWTVADLEVTCDDRDAIQQRCGSGIRLSDSDFRDMYRGVHQTIWGRFAVEQDGRVVAKLDAHDSSYWVIESTDPAFEAFMLDRYGPYGV